MTQRIPALHRAIPRAYVELNREDAERLGIRDREVVRLVSRRGSLEVPARIEYRSQPSRGQLFIPSFDEAVPVHVLTLDAAARSPANPTPGSARCEWSALAGEPARDAPRPSSRSACCWASS